jgi:hypothetical protein
MSLAPSPTGGVDWRESPSGTAALRTPDSEIAPTERPKPAEKETKRRASFAAARVSPRVAMGCACSAPADDFDDALEPEAFTGPSRTMLARPKVRRAGTPGVFS